MDLVTSKKYILRVKTHCGKCESKLKKYILGIAGISSAKMDEKQGTMTISGSLDPFFNYMMLIEKGFGLKTELLWEQKKPPPSTNNGGSNSSQDEVNAAKSRKLDDHHDPRVIVVIAQQENLSGTKVLESVEIKLSFKSHNGDMIGNKNVELIINQKEVDNNSDHHQKAKTSVNTASAAAGGGLCGASTSCCGNHHHHHRVVDVDQNPNKGFVCGFCGNHAATGYPIFYMGPNGGGFVTPPGPPPPWYGGYSPSAPPMGGSGYYDYYYPHPPPPGSDTSFFNHFSDEYPSGSCHII